MLTDCAFLPEAKRAGRPLQDIRVVNHLRDKLDPQLTTRCRNLEAYVQSTECKDHTQFGVVLYVKHIDDISHSYGTKLEARLAHATYVKGACLRVT